MRNVCKSFHRIHLVGSGYCVTTQYHSNYNHGQHLGKLLHHDAGGGHVDTSQILLWYFQRLRESFRSLSKCFVGIIIELRSKSISTHPSV